MAVAIWGGRSIHSREHDPILSNSTPPNRHPMKIQSPYASVTKTLTGIKGFDEITDGGLPRERTTLVMGGPGCGKTVFALQSLVNAAHRSKEAAIFVAFEESTRQIVAN